MSENDLNKTLRSDDSEPAMATNPQDGAVAVDEKDRTVLLTEKETIVVEKPPQISIIPSNRPRKVYGGMWGPAEIGAVAAGSLVIIAALTVYFFLTLPAQREIERNRATRDRLEQDLASAREKYGSITSTETQVAKLISSVTEFENQFLPVASTGRTSLYQRLNGLIASHGLVNTSGPDYAALEIADQGDNNQTDQERGRAKYRSLFPGAYVTMTLEGSYSNLRRFIREIETANDFVVISAVELEPSDSQQSDKKPAAESQDPDIPDRSYGGVPTGPGFGQRSMGPQPQRPKGRTLGEVVSLRLEMAAYFRRTNISALPPATGQQQ